MLRGAHALDDGLALRVVVQPSVQLRLGDVVALDNGLLPVCVRGIFPQHAHASRLHHVRVDAVVHDELHERGVVAQRPRHSG